MARPILQLQATDEELLELRRMARGTKVSVGDRFRAEIILLRLEGNLICTSFSITMRRINTRPFSAGSKLTVAFTYILLRLALRG